MSLRDWAVWQPVQGGTRRPSLASTQCPPLPLRCRVLFRRFRLTVSKTKSLLDLEDQAEFKKAYVHTQALGATPVV